MEKYKKHIQMGKLVGRAARITWTPWRRPDDQPSRLRKYSTRIYAEAPAPEVAPGFRTTPRHRAQADRPEHQLLFALLVEAAVCAQSPTGEKTTVAKRRVQEEAVSWFLAPPDETLTNFHTVCDHLGLDAGSVREAVRSGTWLASPNQKGTRKPRKSQINAKGGIQWEPNRKRRRM